MKVNVFSAFVVLFVLFSLAPTGYELTRASDLRPERNFELVHNFPTDYNFYLSRIRQGIEGRWTVVEKYTAEPHEGSLIHEMYLLMGQVGRFVRVPWWRTGDIYHVSRIVLAVALLAATASFVRGSFRTTSWALLAFLLAVTASSWPKLVYVEGVPRFGGYMAWWSVMDSLQRITFIPHILAGQSLIVFLISALTKTNKLWSGPSVIFLGFIALLLGFIFPPGLIFVITAMGMYWAIVDRKFKTLVIYGLIFGIGIVSLAYLFSMTSVYPWKRLAEVDIIRPLPFDYIEYAKALGPIAVIGVFGGLWALIKKDRRMYPSIAWVSSWVFLLVVFKFIPQQSPLRFSEMVPHIPLAVLATYFFIHLRSVGVIASMLLVSMGLIHMYSSYLWQKDFVDHKIRAAYPLVPTGSYVMYPLDDFYASMIWLRDNSTRDSVVLSLSTAGNYMPAISGNTVYLGHDNTVAFEQKKDIARSFFAGRMKPEEARVWLKTIRAEFVFFGPEEKEAGGQLDLSKIYSFLAPMYSTNHVIVYKFSTR